MKEGYGMKNGMQELNDLELENIAGGFSAGESYRCKKYLKCPTCLASIPSVTLQFYRGLNPNSEKAWIVKTNCCGTTYSCVESDISRT